MEQLSLALLTVVGAIVFVAVLGALKQQTAGTKLSIGVGIHPAPVAATKTGDQRARPRWLQKLKAESGGYFWLPCPICRENFGGHEWAGLLMDTPNTGTGVCANCVDEARRRTDAMYERAGWVLDPYPPFMKDQRTGEWVQIRQWIDPKWAEVFKVQQGR